MRETIKTVVPAQPAREAFKNEVWCDICGARRADDWETEVTSGYVRDYGPEHEADVCPRCFVDVLLPFIHSHKPERKG